MLTRTVASGASTLTRMFELLVVPRLIHLVPAVFLQVLDDVPAGCRLSEISNLNEQHPQAKKFYFLPLGSSAGLM
jgi:hypothetical protein